MYKSFKGQEESWRINQSVDILWRVTSKLMHGLNLFLVGFWHLTGKQQMVCSWIGNTRKLQLKKWNMLMDVDHTPQKLLIMLTVRWKMASHRTGEVKGSKGPIQNQGSCESGQVVEHTKFLRDCLGSGELGDQRLILRFHQRMGIYILNILYKYHTSDIVLDKTKWLYICTKNVHQPTKKPANKPRILLFRLPKSENFPGLSNNEESSTCSMDMSHTLKSIPISISITNYYVIVPLNDVVKISQANRSCTALTNKIASFLAVA